MRKVGNFISEQTGEADYLEVSKVSDLSKAISPVEFSMLGSQKKDLLIEFDMYSIDSLKMIALRGKVEHGGKYYKSEEVHFDEYEFAESLFHIIEEDRTVDNMTMIKEAKKTIENDIFNILASNLNGSMILKAELPVTGYITSKGMKVITIDSIIMNDLGGYGQYRLSLKLDKCVGDSIISKLIEPKIEIYFNKTKLEINTLDIKSEEDSMVKSFLIETDNFSISSIQEEVEKFDFIPLDLNIEQSIEEFVKNRRSKLSSFDTTEDDYSMFDDIF